MFSTRLQELDAEIASFAAHPPDPASAMRLLDGGAFRRELASVLWSEGFGTGGTLDDSLRERASVLKASAFGGRLFAISPLYVTSICEERCTYCNFRSTNKGVMVDRRRLSEQELLQEARYLAVEKGLRCIELVYASDRAYRSDTMCRHVERVRSLLDSLGGGTVGINAEAMEIRDYEQLLGAGLDFVVLWQETYDEGLYPTYHPGRQTKSRMGYRLDAYERMIVAGVRHIGMGVLSGLAPWRRDWAFLLLHEEYLLREYGQTASIVGLPRLKAAAGASVRETSFAPSDDEFISAVSVHNLFSPAALPFISTRETWELCLTLARGGGALFTLNCSTTPGGYALGAQGYQFPTLNFDAPEAMSLLRSAGFAPETKWVFPDEHYSA